MMVCRPVSLLFDVTAGIVTSRPSSVLLGAGVVVDVVVVVVDDDVTGCDVAVAAADAVATVVVVGCDVTDGVACGAMKGSAEQKEPFISHLG